MYSNGVMSITHAIVANVGTGDPAIVHPHIPDLNRVTIGAIVNTIVADIGSHRAVAADNLVADACFGHSITVHSGIPYING